MPSNHLILYSPLLLLLSIFPGIRSFSLSWLCVSGGQSLGGSASTSVLPMTIQDWFPLGWTGWISLSPRDSQVSSPTHGSKTSILQHSAFFIVQLSHSYMTTGKTIALITLHFNTLSRFVIAFLRSKRLLISWLQSPSAVILEPKKMNVQVWFPLVPFIFPPFYSCLIQFSVAVWHSLSGSCNDVGITAWT